MKENWKWYLAYVLSSWLSNFGHGMVVTVVGPTQPYLAFNVRVDIDTINLVWTFGFFGFTLGAIVTGFVFRRYCVTGGSKMLFLWITMLLNGAIMVGLPFIDNFGALVFARCLQNICLGAYITADTSLVVYTMGPIKSRPFTFALHSCIGVGFLAATFLVKPFLPPDTGSTDAASICDSGLSNATNKEEDVLANSDHNLPLLGVRKIAWPFIISGAWCMVFSCGYALLGASSLKMPVFYDDDTVENQSKNDEAQVRIRFWRPLLCLTFIYYVITCGIERIYQPMAFTYGICGPLKMAPSAAVVIDQCYNGGFMAGRLSGIFVSKLLKPRSMIVVSLVCCIIASVVLVSVGATSVLGVYIGTCVLGYFVSWQFGACYSWIAQKGDITGRLASLFLVGCGTGGAIFPPVSGFVFTSSWGPVGILHLTLIFCCVQTLLFAGMYLISRNRRNVPSNQEMTPINS